MLYVRDEKTGHEHECPTGARVVIGRPSPDSRVDIACDNKHVSRKHCELFANPDGTIKIVDSSAYGTFVNGKRVTKEGVARAGDKIVLGHDYTFSINERATQAEATRLEEEAEATAKMDQPLSDASTRAPVPQKPFADAATVPPVSAGGEITAFGARYRVVRELGRGGMGIVYEGFDDLRQKKCAIKRLLGAGKVPPGVIERFRREAMLGAKLGEHPGIVAIFDLGMIPQTGELYCAMDYVEGVSLTARVRAGGERKDLIDLVIQLARAVDYAHSKGVIHRDLKPDNVLVTKDGVARLTDFGISKALDEGQGLTATGTVMGTPSYMAPEQLADSKRVGPSTDIYALGGILYFALTKWPPYSGRTLRDVLEQLQLGKLVPPRERDATVPKPLDELCRRTLSVDPGARPKSAGAFADELARLNT
jgi:serine/threonine-protein kinase